MTEKDFAGKIEWEGGIVDALEYGLKSKDCEPGKLHDAWEKLEVKWKSLRSEIEAVENILEEIADDDDDDDGEEDE